MYILLLNAYEYIIDIILYVWESAQPLSQYYQPLIT